MNQSIQQWLNELVPIPAIVQLCNQVLPAFVLVAAMIVVIGFIMSLVGSETVMAPTIQIIVIFACMATAPWMMTIAESLANGLVGAIAGLVPNMNWLPVANPGPNSLALDFTTPFATIGKYVGGSFATPNAQAWEIGKWTDYIFRGVVIAITGAVAVVTVFIMESLLLLQKVILAFSGPLLPIFIASLSIPAMRGAAQNFIKAVLGVMVWPAGWAIAFIGAQAALQHLTPPSWNAPLFQLVLSFMALAIVCGYMVVSTILAPVLIARSLTHGTNFAAGLVGGVSAAGLAGAASSARAGGAIAGAVAGSPAGPSGVATGAAIGSQAGGAAAGAIGLVAQSVDGLDGGSAVPSAKSAGIADAAVAAIRKRA